MVAAFWEMKGVTAEEMDTRLRRQFPGATDAQLRHAAEVAADEETAACRKHTKLKSS
jgi:hypothetical protein